MKVFIKKQISIIFFELPLDFLYLIVVYFDETVIKIFKLFDKIGLLYNFKFIKDNL